MHILRSGLVVVGVLLSSRADAQAPPTFEAGKKEEIKDVKTVEWTAKGEAGLVATTGNSRTTTITGSANVTRKDKDNKLEASADGAFSRATVRIAADTNGNGAIDPNELSTSTATAAENAKIKLRYDRYLTELDAMYAAALAGFDHAAGKDFQGGAQLGYSRGLYKTKVHEVLGEVGYDYTYLKLATGDTASIHSARGFVGYKGKLAETTALEASLEGLFNLNTVTIGDRQAGFFKDARLNGMVGVTTSLSTKLSLSASFTVRYDNFPAPLAKFGGLPYAPGFEPLADKVDTITKVTVIMKFL
jgi:hypothetical protein